MSKKRKIEKSLFTDIDAERCEIFRDEDLRWPSFNENLNNKNSYSIGTVTTYFLRELKKAAKFKFLVSDIPLMSEIETNQFLKVLKDRCNLLTNFQSKKKTKVKSKYDAVDALKAINLLFGAQKMGTNKSLFSASFLKELGKKKNLFLKDISQREKDRKKKAIQRKAPIRTMRPAGYTVMPRYEYIKHFLDQGWKLVRGFHNTSEFDYIGLERYWLVKGNYSIIISDSFDGQHSFQMHLGFLSDIYLDQNFMRWIPIVYKVHGRESTKGVDVVIAQALVYSDILTSFDVYNEGMEYSQSTADQLTSEIFSLRMEKDDIMVALLRKVSHNPAYQISAIQKDIKPLIFSLLSTILSGNIYGINPDIELQPDGTATAEQITMEFYNPSFEKRWKPQVRSEKDIFTYIAQVIVICNKYSSKKLEMPFIKK